MYSLFIFIFIHRQPGSTLFPYTTLFRSLVSVTERTREIGVRKALGATRFNILFQFLVEALVLCMAGGVIGILIGTGGAIVLSQLAHWNTSISIFAIVLAFFFSALVGLLFGVWPARRAASLDPIDALRYE